MRLSQEKIKAGILHSSQAVRDAAARHFSESYTCDTSLLPLAVEAVQRYGWDNAFLWPNSMALLPVDESGLSWVLEEIERKKARPFSYWAGRHWDTLHWLLCGADAHLLARHLRDIEGLYDLDSHVRSCVGRIVLLSREPEPAGGNWSNTAWTCTICTTRLGTPMKGVPSLIEAIARRKERYAERVLSLLEERLDNEDAGPGIGCSVLLHGWPARCWTGGSGPVPHRQVGTICRCRFDGGRVLSHWHSWRRRHDPRGGGDRA